MKAVILVPHQATGGPSVRLADVERPEAGAGELVVEMRACGLCGTDLEKMRGGYTASMPVLGHEAVGVVSEVGVGVESFRVGDRVFPHHHVPCGECFLCRAGSETMCERYRSSNIAPGGFSEFFRVPRWNVDRGGVLALPDGVSFDLGALIEPVACCLRALGKMKVRADDEVLVAGAGPVGLMHALLLRHAGARVTITDVSEARLRFAEREQVGTVFDARADVPREVKERTKGRGADAAVVATGSTSAILQSLHSVRKGGQVCLFGVPPVGSVLQYDVSTLYNAEQRVITSYAATEADTRAALGVLRSNADAFARLVTDRVPLAEFERAVEVASKGDSMKVLVVP